MKRESFEHTVRAAGAILGVNKVLVIGDILESRLKKIKNLDPKIRLVVANRIRRQEVYS